jgi:hypothetical protein
VLRGLSLPPTPVKPTRRGDLWCDCNRTAMKPTGEGDLN